MRELRPFYNAYCMWAGAYKEQYEQQSFLPHTCVCLYLSYSKCVVRFANDAK